MDGEIAPLAALSVPVTDRGFLLGDAVYETLRTYDGRLFALAEHLDRLAASLAGIGLDAAPPRARLASWLREAAAVTVEKTGGETVVRVTVTRGSGPHGVSPAHAGPPRVIVIARPLPAAPDRLYTEGIRVVTSRLRRAPRAVQDPTIKATSALALVLARSEADAVGADESLLLDAEGRYLEATAANLFVLRDGSFWTPRGEDGVLEGVTGRFVARLLEEDGWMARRAPVPPDVLRAAEEVFLTQTTREVLPVVEVDGEPVASGRPGPVATRLRARFVDGVQAHLDAS